MSLRFMSVQTKSSFERKEYRYNDDIIVVYRNNWWIFFHPKDLTETVENEFCQDIYKFKMRLTPINRIPFTLLEESVILTEINWLNSKKTSQYICTAKTLNCTGPVYTEMPKWPVFPRGRELLYTDKLRQDLPQNEDDEKEISAFVKD